MCVATIDFAKVFDTIQHGAMWRSLGKQSISEQYICLVKKPHVDQCASVLTDVESQTIPDSSRHEAGRPLEFSVVQLGASVCEGKGNLVLEGERLWNQIGRWKKVLHPKFVLLLLASSLNQRKKMCSLTKYQTNKKM